MVCWAVFPKYLRKTTFSPAFLQITTKLKRNQMLVEAPCFSRGKLDFSPAKEEFTLEMGF
jgi:hypothetical protein